MRLGILKAGDAPEELSAHGSYPGMFRAFFGEDTFDYVEYDVRGGHLPVHAGECPAYLVTGSAADAYGVEPWIAALRSFLVAAAGNVRLLGVCFGHQVMAEAFGGKVAKSPGGWGLGAQTYRVLAPCAWVGGSGNLTLPLSHRDQVIVAPPKSEVIAGNAFTPIGMLSYCDHPSLSLQPHPEFTEAFAAALVERRRGNGIDDRQADAALASLRQRLDRTRAAGWLADFLKGAVVPA